MLATCKLERELKLDEAGGGGVREGTPFRKPLDFEKRPLVFMLGSFIDWQLCHQAKIIIVRHVSTYSLKGNKSNVRLKTSFSCALTLTVH